MTIGFHYHIPALQKEDGKIYMPGYLGVFIDGLADQCDEIICFMHSPLISEMKLMDYTLKANNIKLIDIGSHISMMKRALRTRHYANKLLPYLSKIDIMLIRGPSPLLPSFAFTCKENDLPVAYLLVGDYLEGLSAATSMNRLKKSILWIYYAQNKFLQDRDLDKTLVFVNSSKLYEEYKEKTVNCIEVRTTTLSKDDFYIRDDTCKGKTIELLFTGRIDPTKGIEDIFYALANLKKRITENIRINLVGWETSKGFLQKLKLLAKELDMEDNYIFHGKKTVGKELFEMYRKSDIYVLASRGNFEGFPRTLWEAMANSMPIVATKVGGIPLMLTDKENVLLAEPGSAKNIADKINLLLGNESIRKRLIKNGIDAAKDNTIEKQAKNMKLIMEDYLQRGEK